MYYNLLPLLHKNLHENKVTCCEICSPSDYTSPVAHILHNTDLTLLNVNTPTYIPKPLVLNVPIVISSRISDSRGVHNTCPILVNKQHCSIIYIRSPIHTQRLLMPMLILYRRLQMWYVSLSLGLN